MDNFGKPNFYSTCAGKNTGEDILQRPHKHSFNSYEGTNVMSTEEGTMEIVQQMYKIDAPYLSGQHYFQSAASSVHEEWSLPSASIVGNADQQKAEKKRKTDKAYRERCKKKNEQMMQELETLGKENEDLKTENQCLKERNAFLDQSLLSQTNELNEIKYQLDDLRLKNETQNTLVQIFSDRLASPDLCLQNEKLRDENARLREILKLNDGALKLVEENGKLKLENQLLQVKIDALLGQIVNENRRSCGHK
ncbi:hypothetical protein E1A91_A04G070500v1 [Gossypium mustelinum]|uniref:BZIP domain-containing protein n=1 Tax=Gossypium mustelinum TaxID=34275 RepID=A0A5D2ZMQ5_GOSMU|nr:hypothetical protein E1A91_A04G070500v1 [Gossypium mustelinum]TYJ39434.1 hypothetical protein E1A91_A04G070500v1 [Gossypium mustelinum]TYJ39435.1 hypothetical protein E1A91_A04G070500v1 [Gossypium mustelinum]